MTLQKINKNIPSNQTELNYYYTFCRELFIYLILISNYVTEIKSWLSKCYNISDRYCNLDFSIILIVISTGPRNKLGVLLGFEKKDNSTFVGIPIGTPLGFQNPSIYYRASLGLPKKIVSPSIPEKLISICCGYQVTFQKTFWSQLVLVMSPSRQFFGLILILSWGFCTRLVSLGSIFQKKLTSLI